MEDLEKFLTLQGGYKGPLCGYQLLDISELTGNRWTRRSQPRRSRRKAIQKWCEVRNQNWGQQNIQRHRRGDCKCQKI
jgi:hypothetical protein